MRLESLAAIIELLAVYHPAGIRILQGQASALSSEQWVDLADAIRPSVESVHVQSDSSPEDRILSEIRRGEVVAEIIHEAGGWDMIVAAVKSFRVLYGEDWRAFVRYCWVKTAPCRFETVTSLADSLHMDRSTLPRLSRRVSEYIAHMIVSGMIQQPLEIFENASV
ncbi:MAG: hypothetical protein EOM02_02360 [Synergistales bacterium]|nr:hypothetical protein [Synergistales bacterium]